MARYIDADKLIEHLKDEIKACEPKFGGRVNGKSVAYGTELGLKSAISFAETLATADVAPKSEVEFWQDAAANAERETAREIFEKFIIISESPYRIHIIVEKEEFDELKKKYGVTDKNVGCKIEEEKE